MRVLTLRYFAVFIIGLVSGYFVFPHTESQANDLASPSISQDLTAEKPGKALNEFLNFNKNAPSIIAKINAISDPEKREGVMQAFRKDKLRLERAAIAEGEVRRLNGNGTDQLITYEYTAISNMELKDAAEARQYDMEQRLNDLEDRQAELEADQ